MQKTLLHSAIAASLASGIDLPVDECPVPSFDDLSKSLHDAICSISRDSLARDAALLGEHQKLVKTVAEIDPDSAAKTIADIREFIASVDKDGNGAIDGLAAVIEATNNLAPRIEELERRANLTDESISTLEKRTQTLAEADVQIRKEIEELKKREDNAGTSEERVYEIAAGIVCQNVLKPLKSSLDKFNSEVQALDCGKADTVSFLEAVSGGTSFVVAPEAEESSGAMGSVSGTESTVSTSTSEVTTSAEAEAVEAETSVDTSGALGGR